MAASTEQATRGINYAQVMAARDEGRRFHYDERDTMLYALAAGMGRDPLDERELKFVYEGEGFVAMPTLAVVVARSALARTLTLDWPKVLHGEQALTVHRPLPTAAELIADTRITRIVDKGEGKGALIYHQTAARLADSGEPLFTVEASLFARGDGGFGGPNEPGRSLHPIPDRAPDHVCTIQSEPRQALLYRLTGDRNPLHADPALARRVGFERPILHGLCTYAIACRAILSTLCDYRPERIAAFDVRFTAPVMPGDRIETDLWDDGTTVSFRCRVPERGITAIDHGRCELTSAG